MSETETTLLLVGAWFAAWVGTSLVYRASRGKPILYRRLASVRFRERSASGYSHHTWYTKIGGARNCLVVQLTDEELDIHPVMPFNWFFLPEIYDLEFRVPVHQIVSVERRRKFFADCIEIEFTISDGNRKKVTLWLRHPENFVETLRRSPLVRGTLPTITTLSVAAPPGV
jgi:hypothetical protein